MERAFKYIFHILLLAVFPSTAASAQMIGYVIKEGKKDVPAIYDKARDETTAFLSPRLVLKYEEAPAHLNPPGIGPGVAVEVVEMVVYFKHQGKSLVKPDKVTIALRSGSRSGYVYNAHHDLSITADGRQVRSGKMEITEQRYTGDGGYLYTNYWETLETSMGVEEYFHIIDAAKVSLQLGPNEMNLSAEQLKKLRKSAEKIRK